MQSLFSLLALAGLSFSEDPEISENFIKTDDSNLVEGDFCTLYMVEKTVFNKIILENNQEFSSLTLSKGVFLSGNIKGYILESGKVIAFFKEN
ncbi:hypothetical protein [Nostoc sp. CCY 9925]|uniref:hypothetical protein n=1 Tax=Nostoc sp. CCY 9925 TaxID=3103865 RepID=UPI0039C6216A